MIVKRLLTSDELIAHMERKGIAFSIDSKERAKDFLENHNYYMKLASYRENYKKHAEGSEKAGQYIHLEFAYLRELSTIDMSLRYLILQMILDIEHYLKVKLLNAIENNPDEDGYKIIQEFIDKDSDRRSLQKIQKHKSSDYCKDLIEKYNPNFPAWVFVELISFGELAYLCEFYHRKYATKIADRILLNSVQDIRNASAHSNCLINRLVPGNNKAHNSVVARVREIRTIGENARNKKLRNKTLYDFVCLMFAYEEIVTVKATKEKRFRELKKLFEERMVKHGDWFVKNPTISSAYEFAKKVLDNFA